MCRCLCATVNRQEKPPAKAAASETRAIHTETVTSSSVETARTCVDNTKPETTTDTTKIKVQNGSCSTAAAAAHVTAAGQQLPDSDGASSPPDVKAPLDSNAAEDTAAAEMLADARQAIDASVTAADDVADKCAVTATATDNAISRENSKSAPRRSMDVGDYSDDSGSESDDDVTLSSEAGATVLNVKQDKVSSSTL